MKQLSLRGLEEGLSLLAEGLALDEGLDGCTIVEGYRLGLVEVLTIAEFLLDEKLGLIANRMGYMC